MSLQIRIQQHLDVSGQSMRALSMSAGLNPKAVSDILSRPGHRPNRKTIDALGLAMGVELSDPGPRMTYGALIAILSKTTGDGKMNRRNATLVSRLKKVIRAAGWVAETEEVDLYRLLDCFSRWSAATLGISPASFATYKSDVLGAVKLVCGSNRRKGMRDVIGLYREIYNAVAGSLLPDDMKLICGSFFCYLDQKAVLPSEVTPNVLHDYYIHRVATTTKGEATCKKHVKRTAKLCTRLATDPTFAEFRFTAVDHPFSDGRDKYGVPESMFASFLEEFDGPVTRWVTAEESREGQSYDDFLKSLDEQAPMRPATGKKALLKPKNGGRRKTEEERRSAGFLVNDETWTASTLRNRRGILVAGAKALYAATGYGIETIAEYTDPEVVEGVLEAVRAGNSGSAFSSSYPTTIGKTLKKLARDYVARSEDEIDAIALMIADYTSGEKGISRRNKSKLREIVGQREQRLLDLGEILINEVNTDLDRRTGKRSGAARLRNITAENARDVMCAVASDILLARAPRKANVTGIELSWIAWHEEMATITVPNVAVKGRTIDDQDLRIPLDENESRRLRLYVDKIRPKALRAGDDFNPFLFPGQGPSVGPNQPFVGLLERLMRHTKRIVGLRMNPHLYRHFLGWLWLKEDPDRLPDVQRLLGHTSLETTLSYYAEIDENLALDRWHKFLADKKSRQPKSLRKAKGKP